MGLSRRGLLAGAAGLATAAGLAACGSDTGRGDDDGRPILEHWYHQYGEPGVKQAVTRYGRDYPRADVRVQWRAGDYDKQTATALLTADGPDVFETSNAVDQIRGHQIVDLTRVVAPVAAQFPPAVLAPVTYQGRYYGIPQVVDTQLLYYRRSLLAAAGVEPPRTLDGLVAAARATTTPDVAGLFLGNDGGAGSLGATPLRAAGLSQLTTGRDGRVAPGFADPAAAAALAKLHTLYADGSLLLGAPTDWSDPAAIIEGLTAMQWSGLWALPRIVGAFGDDVGVLPFPPDGPGGQPSVPVGAYACVVSARARDVPLAIDYARWLWVDRVDDQLDFAQSYGLHIPARLPLVARAGRLRPPLPAEAARLATTHGAADPLLWSPACTTALQDAMTRIVQGGADPVAQVAGAVEAVRAELDRVSR